MWTRRALWGFIAAGVAGSASAAGQGNGQGQQGHAPPPPPSGGSRKGDVRSLRQFAESTHPRGREAAADPNWRQHWDRVEAAADHASDGALFVALWKGLAWFRDGHTTIIPFEYVGGPPEPFRTGPFGRFFPLKAKAFHDGFWVTEAKDEAGPLLGARILSVNGVSDVDLMKRLYESFPGNAPWTHNWGGVLFNTPGLMQGLGVFDDPSAPIRVEAVDASGRSLSAALRARPEGHQGLAKVGRRESERESWTKANGRGNYIRPLPRSKTLYVSIDDMNDVEGKTFVDLTRELFAAMERPAMQRVILDLSRNGGGNNFNGEPVRKALERSRFNRPGGIYVITSGATFSAAQNLATRLERETYALFVGEPTGGQPNHYGDAARWRGEATGLMGIVSTIPWFDSYPSDRRSFITPDLPVPATFADWRDGRDTAIAIALAHQPATQIDDLSDDRSVVFARASQKVAWKPFWR